MTVEQVGTDAEVGGEEGAVAAEEGDLPGGVVDIAKHLQHVPQLAPHVESQVARPEVVVHPFARAELAVVAHVHGAG